MKTIQELTTEEVQLCLDDVEGNMLTPETILSILEREGVMTDFLDVDAFGSWYAFGMMEFATIDENTEEWQDAYALNFANGVAIAIAIDVLLE